MNDTQDKPLKIIEPTVGRKVWYFPSPADTAGKDGPAIEVNADQPVDATVVAVWGTRLVNLAILDIYGQLHARRSVTLVQDGDEIPAGGRFACWMPYQVGQAKASS